MINLLDIEVMIIACITACACVLPGIFLVLRGVALMTDAISHAVLLGIVLMFVIVQDLHSPWLLLGATGAGVLTVALTEWVIATHCLKKDAAIGLIYPLFFSIGVIIISCFTRNAHLDLDMIFLGDLAYAPFNRIIIAGYDICPRALISMGTILLINALAIVLFYKEIMISIFDPIYATLIGIQPTLFYYGLMLLTSITTVGAFDVIGAIVVIALMITPPATALLLSQHIPRIILISVSVSIGCAIAGYTVAAYYNVSIAGSIASMSGITFLLSLLVSPNQGLIAHHIQQRKQRIQLLQRILFTFLTDKKSISIADATSELGWSRDKLLHIFKEFQKNHPEFVIVDRTIINLKSP